MCVRSWDHLGQVENCFFYDICEHHGLCLRLDQWTHFDHSWPFIFLGLHNETSCLRLQLLLKYMPKKSRNIQRLGSIALICLTHWVGYSAVELFNLIEVKLFHIEAKFLGIESSCGIPKWSSEIAIVIFGIVIFCYITYWCGFFST